jgi:hypothetical protein
MGQKQIVIRIENADTWAAGWITHSLYRMVDRGDVDAIEIKKVKKSKASIEFEIAVFLSGYIAEKILDRTTESARERILAILHRWREKRKQTNLRMYIDDELL